MLETLCLPSPKMVLSVCNHMTLTLPVWLEGGILEKKREFVYILNIFGEKC